MKSKNKINRVYHEECPKIKPVSNVSSVVSMSKAHHRPFPYVFHASRGLQTLAEWSVEDMLPCKLFRTLHQCLMGPIRVLFSMNQGFQALGTDSCPSEITGDPISRVRPIFSNSHARHHGFHSRTSHALMLGILLQISSPRALNKSIV